MGLKYDEIEYSEEYAELFQIVNREVEEILKNQGVKKTLGYIHKFDAKKKEITKKEH